MNILSRGSGKLIIPLVLLNLLLMLASSKAIASNIVPEVYINEIRVDQPGADTHEYAELMGAPGTSLDGLSYIVIGDGAGSGTIEYVVDLSGQTIPASGYFLIAKLNLIGGQQAHTTTQSFERDNVTHMLVSDFTGNDDDDLDPEDDGVLDVTPWSAIVDAISLVGPDVPPAGSEHVYATGLGFTTIGPDDTKSPAHVYRSPEIAVRAPTDEWFIGDVAFGTKDTPGAINATPTAVSMMQEATSRTNSLNVILALLILSSATLILRRNKYD